jgi:hypothetical protein
MASLTASRFSGMCIDSEAIPGQKSRFGELLLLV